MSENSSFIIYDGDIYPAQHLQNLVIPETDYVYEVFRVIDGIPLFLEDHLERVQHSLQQSEINISANVFIPYIHKLIDANNNKEGNIKISIWTDNKGVHTILQYDAHKYPAEADFHEGVKIGLLHAERPFPNAKIFHHSIRKQAVFLIERDELNEVLLVNQNQQITEGSRSNIFFIRDNIIYTAPAKYVLEGVTRTKVLQLIRMIHIPLEEKLLTLSEVKEMESAFLTGTSRRVLPVREIVDIHSSLKVDHPYIIALQRLFLDLTYAYVNVKKHSRHLLSNKPDETL